MKKVFKVLATVFAVSVMSGFAGCKTETDDSPATTETTETIPEGFVKVAGTTIIGVAYENKCTGAFPAGRTVTLSDFYMSEYEITQAEYKAVMQNQEVTVDGTEYTLAAEPSYCTEANKSTYGVNFGTDYGNRPVEGVTWYDAVYFCNAKSTKEGLKPAYEITVTSVNNNHIKGATVTLVDGANGYRLPTEAEWEYAARGGDPEADDWNYVFSGATTENGTYGSSSDSTTSDSALDAVGWYSQNNKTGKTTSDSQISSADGKGTHEVGKKAANRLGLYDMSGNVWEWCYDWYDSSVSSSTDATGPASGEYRVCRGGSLFNGAYCCTVSFRSKAVPSNRNYIIGFRVVRSAK